MEITDFNHIRRTLEGCGLGEWGRRALAAAESLHAKPHGKAAEWGHTLAGLPRIEIARRDLNAAAITVAGEDDDDRAARTIALAAALKKLVPWRKGPFDLCGVYIDAEWRSDWKWARLERHLTPLHGRRVLDVGCNNGYYLWRMQGAGAACAIGADPAPLFTAQFQATRCFIGPELPVCILPVGIESLPPSPAFDTVFSMGVLYHRRDPAAHIAQLRQLLRPGGECVIETLVVTSAAAKTLRPSSTPPSNPLSRYAKMRNVHAIPSLPQLAQWLDQAGLVDVEVIDITRTTTAEQRTTDWMPFESLRDFLSPQNPAKTIEGHPAPLRALVIAQG